MRRQKQKIVDERIINEIMNKSLICRLAFFDHEYPYIIPMNYGYKNEDLYFHCATEGKKIDLIKQNNKVCFEIEQEHEIIKSDTSCKWTTKYRSIIGYGKIEIISDNNEKIKGLDVIMQQHGKMENSYNKKNVDEIYILKLAISDISAKQSSNWE